MQLVHAGIVCSSLQNSDRFFMELLGLNKLSSKTLPAALAGPIFGLRRDMAMLKYGDDQTIFEVLIHPDASGWASPVGHACLMVEDRQGLVRACGQAGLEVRQVPKEDSMLVFIKDFDGNLFEILQG